MKRIVCVFMIMCLLVGALCSCGKPSQKDLPQYPAQQFEICGLWAPRQMTEEAFKLYKDAGFNICSFTNHDDLPRNSTNQYYVGSERTMEALKICKAVGLDVYIAYGASWFNRANEGDEYFDNKPFSTHDLYGEYKDIIKGIHINDEPNKETMEKLARDELIEDFKKIYPDAKYIINLIPETAVTSRDFVDYEEMLKIYGETIMSKFDNPYISVDVYPYSKSTRPESMILYNYRSIAEAAKKYNAETTFILQSSTGNEFLDTLSEADMRQQAYLAIAFGADNLQYYCYSVPEGMDPQYINCMLERDNQTPNQLYYDVQKINKEIQSFASVALAYNWEQSIGISGSVDQTFRVSNIELDENFDPINLKDTRHYVSASGTYDMVLSHFTSEDYGEAYMFVNFAREESGNNTVSAKFKDCRAVAIYGGAGYDGTPKIVSLGEDGGLTLELEYGEGLFVTPIV